MRRSSSLLVCFLIGVLPLLSRCALTQDTRPADAPAAIAPTGPGTAVAKADASLTDHASEAGLFRVSYRTSPDPVPLNQIHSWEVTVRTPDGKPVDDAKVTVDGLMPAHGHGMPTRPQVTKGSGEGVYQVEGMKFQMPGLWVVRVHVEAGAKTDVASFALQL